MADSQSDAVKSPIIMKVEAPVEDQANQDNLNNDKIESNEEDIKPTQICSVISKPSLTPSKLVQLNPFAAKSNTPSSKSVLRPAQLSANTNSQKTSFILNPSRLNPFAKNQQDEASNCENNMKSDQVNSNSDTLKFVPLIQTNNKVNENLVKPVTSNIQTVQTSPSFVFGQNLQERVISDKGIEEPKPSTSLTSNGTSEMLFSSVIKDQVKPEDVSKETKSLSESAREYEESRANKRKYEEVEIRTGEEGETNIMHLSCKLFAYDKATGSWQERGRGNLRLNDLEIDDNNSIYTQSRLVFRTSGSLRVVLNTKVWADMTVDQASAKSIRFTAIDNSGDIKVFLIMANPEESRQFYKYLEHRIKMEKERHKHKKVNLSDSSKDPGGH